MRQHFPRTVLLVVLPIPAALALGCGASTSGSSAAQPQPKLPAAAANSPPVNSAGPAAVEEKAVASAAARDVTFDDVKLEMKKGEPFDVSLLTAKVRDLDGKAIRIRGYILPSFQQTGIKQFVLVRDNMECCFGPGALLHDCILVEMLAPATATFTVRPVSVEGTFSVHEVKGPDGKHLAIYHLDGKEVK